ncbi:MAG: MOSC domain-containing protein [Pseudomonadales bacterium]|nr:MOSC domain-containing protein [Pseudomonadales bacterium]
MGKVESIYIASGKREPVQQVQSAVLEAGKGIVGDRYHSLACATLAKDMEVPANHVSFVAAEELDAFMSRHDLKLDYGEFRRSVITSGIDLNELEGKRFRVGGAVCYGEELCEPCSYLARTVHSAVLPELDARAGLRCTVIESGTIEPGATFEVLAKPS